jgi:prepilin-type processing-associated H-X9-DG protein
MIDTPSQGGRPWQAGNTPHSLCQKNSLRQDSCAVFAEQYWPTNRVSEQDATLSPQPALMNNPGSGYPIRQSRLDHGSGSEHSGFCQFVFVDGSVRALAKDTDERVLGALLTRAGGEAVAPGGRQQPLWAKRRACSRAWHGLLIGRAGRAMAFSTLPKQGGRNKSSVNSSSRRSQQDATRFALCQPTSV